MLAKEKERLAVLRDIKSKLLLEATSGGSGELPTPQNCKIRPPQFSPESFIGLCAHNNLPTAGIFVLLCLPGSAMGLFSSRLGRSGATCFGLLN